MKIIIYLSIITIGIVLKNIQGVCIEKITTTVVYDANGKVTKYRGSTSTKSQSVPVPEVTTTTPTFDNNQISTNQRAIQITTIPVPTTTKVTTKSSIDLIQGKLFLKWRFRHKLISSYILVTLNQNLNKVKAYIAADGDLNVVDNSGRTALIIGKIITDYN